MMITDKFSMEVSPAILLIDPQGRRMKIAGPHHAENAILAADAMYELAGTGKTKTYPDQDQDSDNSGKTILLYYRSHRGRPTKEEIARAARIIARSEITKIGKVRGSRSVVFPEMLVTTKDVAVFLVSKRVWYNENRSVENFPCGRNQTMEFLIDLNGRLTEGTVSCEKP